MGADNMNRQLQDLLNYFDPIGGAPVESPDRAEYEQIRKMIDQVGIPCALVVGKSMRGETIPPDVSSMVDQMVDGVAERIAALHAKLPKITPAAEVESIQ